MVKVESPIPRPSVSRRSKRHPLPIILVVAVVLILVAIGAYSVYHYDGAGILFDQKHHTQPKLISQNLPASPRSSVVTLSTSTAQSNTSTDTVKASPPSGTTQSISLVSSKTVATADPPAASCSNTNQQTHITQLQTQLNALKQQRSQLSQSISNLLGNISAVTNQQLQQLQTQIDSLSNQLQTLEAATPTC